MNQNAYQPPTPEPEFEPKSSAAIPKVVGIISFVFFVCSVIYSTCMVRDKEWMVTALVEREGLSSTAMEGEQRILKEARWKRVDE